MSAPACAGDSHFHSFAERQTTEHVAGDVIVNISNKRQLKVYHVQVYNYRNGY